jgi:hypothetical protein
MMKKAMPGAPLCGLLRLHSKLAEGILKEKLLYQIDWSTSNKAINLMTLTPGEGKPLLKWKVQYSGPP